MSIHCQRGPSLPQCRKWQRRRVLFYQSARQLVTRHTAFLEDIHNRMHSTPTRTGGSSNRSCERVSSLRQARMLRAYPPSCRTAPTRRRHCESFPCQSRCPSPRRASQRASRRNLAGQMGLPLYRDFGRRSLCRKSRSMDEIYPLHQRQALSVGNMSHSISTPF